MGTRQLNNKHKQRFSKFLSLILRHKPEEVGLELMENGWVDLDNLINAINSSAKSEYKVDRQLIEEIVAEDEKQRYSISEDGKLIRANQGHSIENLIMDYKEVSIEDLPNTLYHGTSVANYNKIIESGAIKPMSRQLVHLSKDIETASKVGKRHGELVVIEINTESLVNDGHKVFISENGVYLVDEVPVKFIVR